MGVPWWRAKYYFALKAPLENQKNFKPLSPEEKRLVERLVQMENNPLKIKPVGHVFEPLSPSEIESLEQFFDKKKRNETDNIEV